MTYIIDHPIKNDVQAPRWLGYGTGASHALLVPQDEPLEGGPGGKIKAACGTWLIVSRLATDYNKRCKRCTALFVERKATANAGLSEPQVDIVHTGAQHGSPREAERKVAAELLPLSGDAAKVNAEIVGLLRVGHREAAMDTARDLDVRATVPSDLVPHAPSADAALGVSKIIGRSDTSLRAVGQREESRINGVAMVQGANMPPVQPMRRHPKSGELEVSSLGTMGGGLGRERPDSEIVKDGRPVVFETRTQKRNRQRVARQRAIAAENLALREAAAGMVINPLRAERKRSVGPRGTGCSTSGGSLVDAGVGSSLHKTASLMERAPGK